MRNAMLIFCTRKSFFYVLLAFPLIQGLDVQIFYIFISTIESNTKYKQQITMNMTGPPCFASQ